MRALVLVLFAAATSWAGAVAVLRTGEPKDCYLYSWGKGPDWVAKVPAEFPLAHLDQQKPAVDGQYEKATARAFIWQGAENHPKPEVSTLALIDGRRVVEIAYPAKEGSGRTFDTVMLAIETEDETGWFTPFFCAHPEKYRGRFVSGRDLACGYIVTLEWTDENPPSADFTKSGVRRSHLVFDLRQPHPVMSASHQMARGVTESSDMDDNVRQGIFKP